MTATFRPGRRIHKISTAVHFSIRSLMDLKFNVHGVPEPVPAAHPGGMPSSSLSG